VNPEKEHIERKNTVTESILDHKKLLIVDDESDVLETVEELILTSCPGTRIDKATNYEDASKLLECNDYDLVVLDIMGVNGFDLLGIAVRRGFKVAMLTAHALAPETLKKSHDMGAMSYLPKGKLGELVGFLEDVLQYDHESGWKRLLEKLESYFNEAWGPDWWDKSWY